MDETIAVKAPEAHQTMSAAARRAGGARRRRGSTRRSVRIADAVSKLLISVGGIGTIIAVGAVFLFLVTVAMPLFLPARVAIAHAHDAAAGDQAGAAAPIVELMVDEYLTSVGVISADGVFSIRSLRTADVLLERPVLDSADAAEVTAWSISPDDDTAIAAFADGRIQVLRLGFRAEFIDESEAPAALFEMEIGATTPFRKGIVELTGVGQFRYQEAYVELVGPPKQVADAPIRRLTHSFDGDAFHIAALVESPAGGGRLVYLSADESENILTGEATFKFGEVVDVPMDLGEDSAGDTPEFLRMSAAGDLLYIAWSDGRLQRIRIGASGESRIVEQIDVAPDDSARLTSTEFLLGGGTLITGDSNGALAGWFIAPQRARSVREGIDGTTVPSHATNRHASAPENADRFELVRAKELNTVSDAAVTSIAPGKRSRIFAAGFADGSIELFYMTSEERLTQIKAPSGDGGPIVALAISPKENAIVAVTPARLLSWSFDPRYPEVSLRALFAPVWYERYPEPAHMWQSSSGTDDFEPKFGMTPLIFGTIKATIYSMLFGAPIALLAAIYSSEFLDPKWKSWIKPTIEMMASLPSVVLGFFAALVIAPYVEEVLPATLASFFVVPFCFVLGGLLWQLAPRRLTARFSGMRFILVAPVLVFGILLASWLGPAVEDGLFGGSIKAWLNGLHAGPPAGEPLGGWVFVLTPVCALLVAIATSLWINPRLRRATANASPRWSALIEIAKFAVGVSLTLGFVLVIGWMFGALGFDVRKPMPFAGALLDTYDQRNALIVGFIMGFAIIPIIYTIADDALTTVPGHLRSASLAAGATPWQTAVRIVIPTAMSGLFSALMIGLGRAVGETMIVLMAAGNTPVMNMNLFEGFRTLSANIAVELPEAPVGQTHYRTLFFAALVLFLMTFIVNTVAEIVRLRFRKRAYQL